MVEKKSAPNLAKMSFIVLLSAEWWLGEWK
jgi:hypothetical protein